MKCICEKFILIILDFTDLDKICSFLTLMKVVPLLILKMRSWQHMVEHRHVKAGSWADNLYLHFIHIEDFAVNYPLQSGLDCILMTAWKKRNLQVFWKDNNKTIELNDGEETVYC